MAQDLDRRNESVDRDRRLVKRFSDPELRATAAQIKTLLKVIMVVLAVVIGDQIYLATLERSYVPHAVFYAVVCLMILIQAGNYHNSLGHYNDGESATSMVHSFHSQRNFFAMITFMFAIFTAAVIIGQLH